jgi:DNA-binding HxlR family transcriptional regulator
MRSYGQFCPVAKASEVFAERWTPLIVRELLLGSHRFNDLERGLPRISRSLLAQRLKSLESAGLIERHADPNERGAEYYLTAAGQELFEIIMKLGEWGQRWVNQQVRPSDIDPRFLLWDMRRRIHIDQLPEGRTVVEIDLYGASKGCFWLLLERPEPSLCLYHLGFEVDLVVNADTASLHQVWAGHMSWADAFHLGLIHVSGPSTLVRAFPGWFALGMFAHIPPTGQPVGA